MTQFFENVTKLYEDLQVGASPVLDSYPLMKTPTAMLTILSIYWVFVAVAPKIMKNRKPVDVNDYMIVYNLYQVVFSTWLIFVGSRGEGIKQFMWNAGCGQPDVNMEVVRTVYYCGWWYMVNKFVELIDTVFLILKKKPVIFLHVYHHSNMGILTWVFVKYTSAEQLLFCGLINSVVHVIMYFYYFLAALGPKYKKYLGWKKHLTRIQIGQFIIAIFYFASTMVRQCYMHRVVTVLLSTNTVIFLYLFVKYYNDSYNNKKSKQDQKLEVNNNNNNEIFEKCFLVQPSFENKVKSS